MEHPFEERGESESAGEATKEADPARLFAGLFIDFIVDPDFPDRCQKERADNHSHK